MRMALLFVLCCVGAVLYNAGPVPVPPPWGVFLLPETSVACTQSHGTWRPALVVPVFPYSIESDKPARCQIEYNDQDVVCKTSDDCKSHVCIVHPIKHRGSCFGMLPPRGQFDFLDAKGNKHTAKLPL